MTFWIQHIQTRVWEDFSPDTFILKLMWTSDFNSTEQYIAGVYVSALV